MKSIVILASGRGSNAAQVMSHFAGIENIKVTALISDRKESGALSIAEQHGVTPFHLRYSEMRSGGLLSQLEALSPDLIVLAGFLRMIPIDVIQAYPDAIVNVHPSLLPNHGGPGMYGMHVHEAVIAAGDTTSGITIHYVNEEYDKGRVIAQFHCPVSTDDNPETLAKKVLGLEHHYLPLVIHAILSL